MFFSLKGLSQGPDMLHTWHMPYFTSNLTFLPILTFDMRIAYQCDWFRVMHFHVMRAIFSRPIYPLQSISPTFYKQLLSLCLYFLTKENWQESCS